MTISAEVEKLQQNLTASYQACDNKGATMPASQNFDNLANTISTITGGGGSIVNVKAIGGTQSYTEGDKVILYPTNLVSGDDLAGMFPYFSYTNQTSNYTVDSITGFVTDNLGQNDFGDTILRVETTQDPTYEWTNINIVFGMDVTVTGAF